MPATEGVLKVEDTPLVGKTKGITGSSSLKLTAQFWAVNIVCDCAEGKVMKLMTVHYSFRDDHSHRLILRSALHIFCFPILVNPKYAYLMGERNFISIDKWGSHCEYRWHVYDRPILDYLKL